MKLNSGIKNRVVTVEIKLFHSNSSPTAFKITELYKTLFKLHCPSQQLPEQSPNSQLGLLWGSETLHNLSLVIKLGCKTRLQTHLCLILIHCVIKANYEMNTWLGLFYKKWYVWCIHKQVHNISKYIHISNMPKQLSL